MFSIYNEDDLDPGFATKLIKIFFEISVNQNIKKRRTLKYPRTSICSQTEATSTV